MRRDQQPQAPRTSSLLTTCFQSRHVDARFSMEFAHGEKVYFFCNRRGRLAREKNEPTPLPAMNQVITLLATLTLSVAAHAGLRYENLDAAAVGRCLAPLSQSADAATARACANDLGSLSTTQPTAQSTATFQLSCLITNLLDAETTLMHARQGIFEADKQARAAEADSRQWLKPNAFGHTNPTIYHNSRNVGQSIRQQAASRRDAAQAHYHHLMNAGHETVNGLEQVGHTRISGPLSSAINAIASRTGKSLPSEKEEIAGTVLGLAAIAGLLWVGSEILGGSSRSDDQGELNRQMQMNEQIQRNRARDEAADQARRDAAERAAIEAQHARWRAESMRPFN